MIGKILIIKINILKQNKFFKIEQEFFIYHKKAFVNKLANALIDAKKYKYCILDEQIIAKHFYDALFNYKSDCYEKQLYCLKALSKNSSKVKYITSDLLLNLVKDYIEYKKKDASQSIIELFRLCTSLQKKLLKILHEKPHITFDVLPSLDKEKYIRYLFNESRLNEKIKLIVYHEDNTNIKEIEIVQVGKNSIVIKTDDEQIEMFKKINNCFLVLDKINKKYFGASSKILCEKDGTVVLENINKLEANLLLKRKYPRATIVNNILIYIANEKGYISGNLIDISEGGIGVLSPSKSDFEKGQDVVVFITYEDKDSAFNLSFESSGILASIIGKKSVFRYGIQLLLPEEVRESVRNLVNKILNEQAKDDKEDY